MTETAIIFTVSQLNRKIRCHLEQDIGLISVEGEISNLTKPSSGHYYFTLKDENAQLKCVYFRNRHFNNQITLQNGQHIVAHGVLSLYETRGDFQLIINLIEETGAGNLYLQFEQLKKKLAASGLFDIGRKKPLPLYPHKIGVITSPTGAAIQDILTTLSRRYPLAEVNIYPVEVQGKQAASQLIQAIITANITQTVDVLIIARGGGSIEDLWAFNDENLAHTIANSKIPIVSGVGHETDFTISDFVADLRAATPTAAAEAVSPNILDLNNLIVSLRHKLLQAIKQILQQASFLLHHNRQKISSPQLIINHHWQTLDFNKNNLQKAWEKIIYNKNNLLHLARISLQAQNPIAVLKQNQQQLTFLDKKIKQQMAITIQSAQHRLKNYMTTLHAVSPLATLDRGYSIVSFKDKIIRTATDVKVKDNVKIRLAHGLIKAKVYNVE